MSKNKLNKPPAFAWWMLNLLCRPDKRETCHDEFEEVYRMIEEEDGIFRARIWYVIQILKIIKGKLFNLQYWSLSMFKNYIKITFRNILRNKGYSMINISGLALGIASAMLLFSYVNYELSFDKYHEKADRIYRIVVRGRMAGEDYDNAKIPATMTPLLLSDYPEIENTVRFTSEIFNMFRYRDKKFYEPRFMYADSSVFKVFSYSLIKGDYSTALKAPNTIVLTQETAYKYFGDEDPMGKMIRLNDEADLAVTGIMKSPPDNSHLKFDMLISFETFIKYSSWAARSLTSFNSYTYIILKEGIDSDHFKKKCVDFFDKHIGEQFKSTGGELSCRLQPLTSIHLHSDLQNDNPENTSIIYVYTFIVIAILILLVACINYINLSTARSVIRAKEIGVRKVLGAFKGQIIRQFIGESFFYEFLALLFGITLVIVTLPLFRELSGQPLTIDFFIQPLFWIELVLIMGFVCIIAGGYPAFLLSGFKPVKTLKGIFHTDRKNSLFRNILVLFQFTVLTALVIITVGILSQLNFIKERNLGFDKDQLLYIKFQNNHSDNDNRINWINSLKAELVTLDGVIHGSLSNHVPSNGYFRGQFNPEGFPENQIFNMETYLIDDDFLSTYGIDLGEGRGFSKKFTNDAENAVIINETAARQFGWENPVGKSILRLSKYGNQDYHVIGMVKDFHSRTLHHSIEPMIFQKFDDFHSLTLRLKTENIAHTMKLIEKKWRAFEPDHPFEFFFLDDYFNSLYKTEVNLGKIVRIFTFLAVCIGCLGLFGVMSFMTAQRTKEIGIRKTVGASVTNISLLLTKEFIKWVVLANLFAWPIAYLALNRWLQNFAYKTEVGWGIFIFSGFVSLLIAIITIGHRVLKAAKTNPVESLRYE